MRDGVPRHTGLGKGPLFLISCLSAKTAREYALPTSDWRLLFLPYHESRYRSPRIVGERHDNT